MGYLIKWLFIFGILYYILTKFIFPIFSITVAARRGMRDMQAKMKEMETRMNQQQQPQQRTGTRKQGEYIDYEELK